MKKVLILIPYYKPGYRSGGPQRTVENVCSAYHDKAEIYIATQNFDLGVPDKPYDIKNGEWLELDGIRIMYMEHRKYNIVSLKKLYKEFDIIYSCGLFEINSLSILLLNKFFYNRNKKVYIAPMGVFSPGAFRSKHKKKSAFIGLVKNLGLYKNIIWSFTSEKECDNAIRIFGNELFVKNHIFAEDLPSSVDFQKSYRCIENKTDTDVLNVVFLSRICPQKNLLYAIKVLKCSQTVKNIKFDIYGIVEDRDYWNLCQKEIRDMPSNINVKYMGAVKPDDVIDTFRKYDVFLFPTKGENYGHVIYEALAAGCIPIISDQTSWNDLDEEGCGRVISLLMQHEFVLAIENYCNCSRETLYLVQNRSIEYSINKRLSSIKYSGYSCIF